MAFFRACSISGGSFFGTLVWTSGVRVLDVLGMRPSEDELEMMTLGFFLDCDPCFVRTFGEFAFGGWETNASDDELETTTLVFFRDCGPCFARTSGEIASGGCETGTAGVTRMRGLGTETAESESRGESKG